jgi:hypothetical protein
MNGGNIKFVITIDDCGNVTVLNGNGEPIADDNMGSLSTTPMSLHDQTELVFFDSFAVMGLGGPDKVIQHLCVKRANCTWYCS